MELAFESESLRTICENEARAAVELGPEVAAMLKRRLADLRAATSVADLVAGRPRVLPDENGERLVIEFCEGYKIVLVGNHPKNPSDDAGGLDWPRIRRLRLVRLERDDD